MKKLVSTFLMLSLCLGIYYASWLRLNDQRQRILNYNYIDYTVTSKILGPISLEFKGIMSDFLFLKMIVFLGQELTRSDELTEKHSIYLYNAVENLTDLDPWFWDAYLLANLWLTWDYKKYDEANQLLFKARKYRTWDYKVPYYIGFNYFYYMKDNINGAKYLMEASKVPGCPTDIALLAGRLSYYEYQYSNAAAYFMEFLQRVKDPKVADMIKVRIITLLTLEQLQISVEKYKAKFDKSPGALSDLIAGGIVPFIPDDPCGGEFILLENGQVYTTSKMLCKQISGLD